MGTEAKTTITAQAAAAAVAIRGRKALNLSCGRRVQAISIVVFYRELRLVSKNKGEQLFAHFPFQLAHSIVFSIALHLLFSLILSADGVCMHYNKAAGTWSVTVLSYYT